MAFQERLALIVQANVDQALREIGRLGDKAEKEVGRAKSNTERFASQATKVGAGLIGFAGVAGAGLFKMAQASEDANRSTLLLENTLANAPKLAGEAKGQFIELADAIQDKTAADADQIVSAQAMLGTFQLTAEQIKGVTPLVVDYARKFGVDLVSASVQVGKALDGQVGALKRNGVSIDENLFKTDRFAAVTKALREQVGGFAEEEGKNLSGRLQRLKNELGDVEEGIGAGVGGAFSTALTPVEEFVGGLNRVPPELLKTAGGLATVATGTAAAVGGLALLAGGVARTKNALTVGGQGLNNFGKAAAALGTAGALVGLVTTLKSVHDEVRRVKVDFEELANATNDDLVRSFQSAVKWGKSSEAVFKAIAEASVTDGQRLVDSLKAQGVETGKYQKILDGLIAKRKQADATARKNAEALSAEEDATDDTSGAVDDLAKRTEAAAEAKEKYRKEIEEATEALDDHREAVLADADAEVALARADDAVQDALNSYNAAVKDHGVKSDEARRKTLDYRDAISRAAATAVEAAEADRKAHGEAALTTQQKVGIQITELEKLRGALDPKSPLIAVINDYIARLQAIPTQINTQLHIKGSGEVFVQTPGGSKLMAHGGVVRHTPGGVAATLAEAGDEAVIPLDDPERAAQLLRQGGVQLPGAAGTVRVFQFREGAIQIQTTGDPDRAAMATHRVLRRLSWELGAA